MRICGCVDGLIKLISKIDLFGKAIIKSMVDLD